MKIKNDLIRIKVGKKKYDFNNLILNEYLRHFAIAQIDKEHTLNQYLSQSRELLYILLKLDTVLSITENSELSYDQFDICIISGGQTYQELSEKKIITQYDYNLKANDFVVDIPVVLQTGTGANGGIKYLDEFFDKKITAIGFTTGWSPYGNYPVCAVLDTSNYNIYLESNQDFAITRRDIITTDAEFYSNDREKVPAPAHLAPCGLPQIIYQPPIATEGGGTSLFYDNAYGILYSIGKGYTPMKMEEEKIIGEDAELVNNGTSLTISSISNEDIRTEALYPSEDLYPIGKFTEEIQTSKKGVEVSLEGNGQDAFVKIDGKSVQETRSGKNLFNKNGDFTYGNTNYKTTLQADGTLLSTANFTNNRSAGLLIENLKQNTIYTVSGTLISADGTATNNAIIEVLSTENVGLNRYYILATEIKPFNFVFYFNTGTNSSAYISLSGIGPTTQTSTNTVFDKIQIEEGNTVTDYEEYGASPSPEYPSPIHSLGDDVNLFDGEIEDYETGTFHAGYTLDGKNKLILTNQGSWGRVGCTISNLEKNTEYTISSEVINDEESYCGFYSPNVTSRDMRTDSKFKAIITISSDSEGKIYFEFYGNLTDTALYNVVVFDKIKLQKGTVATSYSEYGKGTVTIEQRGKNLLKGLSTPLDDTNYWYATTPSYFTPLEDGWGKFEYDNTNGTGTIFINAKVKQSAVKLKPNSTYTIITEIRNSSISENSGAFFQLITNNATTSSSENKNLSYSQINKEGTYKSKFLTKPDFSKVEVAIDTYLRLAVGTKGKVEARISLVEGDIDITDFDYEPYFSKDYVLQVSEPLRSLPNGIKDTIEEDGIHRRVGIGKFQAVNQLYDSRGFKYGTNSIKSINTSAENINIICDKAICNIVNAKTNDIYITNFGNTLVIFGSTDDTVETFNAKFAGAEYIYELAEEVVEPFDEEQQELLNSIETQKGTNIFSINDELEPEIQVTEYKSPLYPIEDNYKYIILKYKVWQMVATGEYTEEDGYIQEMTDTGYYYHQAVPLEEFGTLKTTIKYERG